ncbi:hypothetical protein Patl1_19499 [Pistacia atlantica]|uniref:Uncharacterized protein n=1 Tax=Pistacia atlantica TaxID=434234 RepID=A0ACC1BZX7_9ROSI|nr:hypothetical protein Patl1_19499 [Pistacia atlantica]
MFWSLLIKYHLWLLPYTQLQAGERSISPRK